MSVRGGQRGSTSIGGVEVSFNSWMESTLLPSGSSSRSSMGGPRRCFDFSSSDSAGKANGLFLSGLEEDDTFFGDFKLSLSYITVGGVNFSYPFSTIGLHRFTFGRLSNVLRCIFMYLDKIGNLSRIKRATVLFFCHL